MEQARDIEVASDPLLKRIPRFIDAVKLQESVFALPFAYSGTVLAADGWPTFGQLAWITVAMVSARTLGMTANRVIDRHIDARNPRTAKRHLPTGALRFSDMTALSVVAAVVFFIAAAQLNTLALALAPLAAGYLIFYPFTKRFTWFSSFFLGWGLAIAPSAAWIGVKGALGWEPVLLSTAVALWAASFDMLYHAQDREFYAEHDLHSIAKRFGVLGAFRVARTLDIVAVACLVGVGIILELAFPYYLGCAIAAAIMAYKYRMVSPNDLSRMGVAFMRTNAYVSLSVFVGTIVAVLAT